MRPAAVGRPAPPAPCASPCAPPPVRRPRGRRRSGRGAPGTAQHLVRTVVRRHQVEQPGDGRPLPVGGAGRPHLLRPARRHRAVHGASCPAGRRQSERLALRARTARNPRCRRRWSDSSQLPPLGAEPVEHRTGVTLLAFGLPAGELDADPGALRLGVVGRDDGGVFPRGHPQTVTNGGRVRPVPAAPRTRRGGSSGSRRTRAARPAGSRRPRPRRRPGPARPGRRRRRRPPARRCRPAAG